MEDSENTNPAPKEPGKTICNRCMSEVTGIKDDFEDDDSDTVDLSEIFDHMEFSLSNLHDKIKSGEKQMAFIYTNYIYKEIMILRNKLDLVDYCTCGDDHEDDDDEDAE